MKKFILKLLLFVIICGVLDIFVGYITTTLQDTNKSRMTNKDEYIKSEINADLVIMGSSRAVHHYVSNLMADSLKCSVYNTGWEGMGIIMNYGVLLEIINRYNPKTIIYDLAPGFDWLKGSNEKYLAHLRHVYDYDGIDSIFWEVNPNERIKMLSRSYRTNSFVPHLLYYNFFADKDTLNGYVPLWNKMQLSIKEKENKKNYDTEYAIDPLKVKYLQKMINLCSRKNINLIFAISPILGSPEDYFSFGENLALSNNIRVINFKNMNVDFKEDLFQDGSHMNNDGAVKYTSELIKYVRE